ncbi:hypothetical protein [Chelativorans alearense]|uniref:hypothetical protein n=1 Tax=Chelativorans alearense TaxID=2681495 RepID=UPI0013D1BB63|nr:hypothetical protein [Chelativorans alearense]
MSTIVVPVVLVGATFLVVIASIRISLAPQIAGDLVERATGRVKHRNNKVSSITINKMADM